MVTNIFLLVAFGASYLAFQRPLWIERFCHAPFAELHRGEWHRFVSSGFLHGSWNHLLINLFVLYQFGGFVEQFLISRFGTVTGTTLTAFFYLSSIVVANIGTFIRHRNNPGFRSLGASGVTSAAVLVYVLFNPWEMFIFPPVPAIVFGILYLVYSTWASNRQGDHIDHQAHLWGSLYGVVFILLVEPGVLDLFMSRISSF